MDLKTIKTFLTVVRLRSFQRAAEELNYAQSTVTMQIKGLEKELNVVLLERDNDLQLTEAGRLLNEKGELLLKGFDSLQNAMIDLLHGESGFIRLGVMEPTASFHLPPILAPFREKFPKMRLSIQIHSSKDLIEMVRKDEVDLALCSAPELSDEAVFQPLFQEKVGLLVPKDHPLAVKESVYLEDLQTEALLTTTSSCPFRRNFEKEMIEKGITPQYGLEISNLLTMKYYVQANYGIAVVPLITVTPPPEGTVVRPIKNFQNGLTVGLLKDAVYDHTRVAMGYLMEIIEQEFLQTIKQ